MNNDKRELLYWLGLSVITIGGLIAMFWFFSTLPEEPNSFPELLYLCVGIFGSILLFSAIITLYLVLGERLCYQPFIKLLLFTMFGRKAREMFKDEKEGGKNEKANKMER